MNYTPSPGNPRVNLALQGGGSHGAFTWGVLDALLDDGRVSFEGISGTSAGAMNAVALAHGFAQAEGKTALQMRESARASLQHFWDGVVDMGAMGNSISQAQRAPFDILFGGFAGLMGQQSPGQMVNDAMTSFWSKSVSPYQSNPLDINPLQKFQGAQGVCGGDHGDHRQGRGVFRQAPECQGGDGVGLSARGVSGGRD
jgi:NTE family protein